MKQFTIKIEGPPHVAEKLRQQVAACLQETSAGRRASVGEVIPSGPDTKRLARILEMAYEQRHEDGEVEIDEDTAISSEGDDNGTYVQAWAWVSFDGTKLDKEKEE